LKQRTDSQCIRIFIGQTINIYRLARLKADLIAWLAVFWLRQYDLTPFSYKVIYGFLYERFYFGISVVFRREMAQVELPVWISKSSLKQSKKSLETARFGILVKSKSILSGLSDTLLEQGN